MKCQFNHRNDPDGWPEATGAFALLTPDNTDNLTLIPQTIHACEECASTLEEENSDWVALICEKCGRGQWAYRPQDKRNKLPADFKVMLSPKGCPICMEKEWNRMKREKYGR